MAQAESVSNAIRALVPGASPQSSTKPVWAAHAEFVTAVAKQQPWPIPLFADASDLEDRADHLKAVLGALSVYIAAILNDTAQNVSGGLELRPIDTLLCKLASEVCGTVKRTADALAERVS